MKKLGRGPRHSLPDEKNSSIDARAWAELRPLKRSWEPSAYIYVVRHIKLAGRVLQHMSLYELAGVWGHGRKRDCVRVRP